MGSISKKFYLCTSKFWWYPKIPRNRETKFVSGKAKKLSMFQTGGLDAWSVMKPFKFFTNTQHWQYCEFWPQRLYYMKPKKIQWQNVTTSEDWTQASSPLFLLHLWFKVQHSPFWANLACATWGSLNVCYCTTWFLDLDYLVGINRAWLYKERKSSILQANAKLAKKRECWTWNQRLIRGLGSIPTGVTFY